jgi:MFS family permease
MQSNTQRGLYFLIIGSIISMVYVITSSIGNHFIQNPLSPILLGIVIFAFIGGIISLIGVILFLIGRKEFGEKHQKNITNAILIFVINIIISIVLISVITFFTISNIISMSAENVIAPFSIGLIITVIISAILGGLIYYFALIELENETGKNVLLAGIFSSIIISVITSIYIAGIFGEVLGSISTENYSPMSFNQNFGLISLLGVIPTIFYIFAFYIPYNRIKTGELKPQIVTLVQPSASDRICPNCNREIPNDANLCPFCGKRFETYL